MRCFIAMALALCIVLPARAGLYNTSEPEEGKLGRDFEAVFRDTLLHLRSIGFPKVERDNPLRKRYELAAALAARNTSSKLSVDQKLNLSAVLIRTRRADEAINLLMPLARQEAKNFLIQSNLATAYHQIGQE